MNKENKIQINSKKFAIRIIRLYQYLSEEKKEHVLSKQLLRCGTSIGANVRESINAQSKADFMSKLNIALKESNETEYWLELLYETDYLTKEQFDSIISDNNNLTGTLINILKTLKSNV